MLYRQVRLAQVALGKLVQCFSVGQPNGSDLAQQVFRNDNSAADAAANWALDHGSFMDVRVQEVQRLVHHLAHCGLHTPGLMFSFDGASRGNPGPSSSGICAWWGYWAEGAFISHGLLLQRGTRLGIGSSNSAEAHGMASALKTALRYLFWVTGHLSELAQHSVRHECQMGA